MPKEHQPTLLADDFVFLEAPRWRDDRLWVSDVFDGKVVVVRLDGSRSVMCEIDDRPCGIGFLADGTPVVVSMRERKLLALVGDGRLALHADLSHLAAGDLNDLVTDAEGRIYVGNFGYDYHGGAPKAPTQLHRVDQDGTIHVAADGLEFPNGAAIIDRGRQLVVAETWACRLTAFDRAPDGTLSNPRLYADLGQREPDGICADSSDGIWVACFNTGEFVRVLEGGEVTDRVVCGRHAIACQVGGPGAKTLFCCAYRGTVGDMEARKRLAAIYTVAI